MTNCPPLRAGTPKLSAAGPDRNVTMPSLKVSCAIPGAANARDIAVAEASVAIRERRLMNSSLVISAAAADLSAPAWPEAGLVAGECRQAFPARLPRGCLRLASIRHLAIENGDGTGPAGGGALDLYRETRHHETSRGQELEIVQLLDVAIADMAAGLVAFPDQARVLCLGVSLRGVNERRIPAPPVDAGQPHAALEQVHRRLIAHAAARIDVVLLAVFGAGAGIDDHDLQWRKRMADALQLIFDILGGCDITVRQ